MLNASQEKAVRAIHGRVLVLAGAGSGKTRVIIQRIIHLIQDHNIDPKQIVGLTFTNKAALEMRTRLEKSIGKQLSSQVTLATFHSFCMKILRKEIHRLGYTRDFSIYDERDVERLMNHLAKDILGVEKNLPSLAKTREVIAKASSLGGECIDADPFSKDLYIRLQTALRSHNAVNFDNLINLTIQLFEEHPDTLEVYQDQYRYFMIDEYQDTNPAQFRLAELLAKKYKNLCVVGDDDQSIYGWRGASVANILNFRFDHKIKLEQNYRSYPSILEAANAVIKNNANRHEKKLFSELSESVPIEVFNAPTDTDEANAIVQRILKYKAEGYRFSEMAILYRSNALSRNLEMALLNTSWKNCGNWVRGIPYEIFGGLEFSQRSEIKDVLSYLRLIANPKDQEALLRIINVPRRGISDRFLDTLTKANRTSLYELLCQVAKDEIVFKDHPRGVSGIKSFVELIEKTKGKFKLPPLHEALSSFLEDVNYKKAILEEVKSEKMRAFKWENVSECVNALAKYEQEKEPTLSDFIANTALASNFSRQEKGNGDKVQMMTLHSAKGLEFPVCFIAGLEDHILPHEKSLKETGLEEERRLFYVGITRAKKHLLLSMARTRMIMGKTRPTTPSRFLFEIPKHLLKATAHK